MELEEVAAIAMTINVFKTRDLFNRKVLPQAEEAPSEGASPEEPAPDPGRT